VSCVAQAKRHARRRRGHTRAFDTLADFDCVGEHALDIINPNDQVARSGWVGFLQQIYSDLLVSGDRVALDDEASGWSSGSHRHRAKVDVDGISENVCLKDRNDEPERGESMGADKNSS
jgi:hypothetical protein